MDGKNYPKWYLPSNDDNKKMVDNGKLSAKTRESVYHNQGKRSKAEAKTSKAWADFHGGPYDESG